MHYTDLTTLEPDKVWSELWGVCFSTLVFGESQGTLEHIAGGQAMDYGWVLKGTTCLTKKYPFPKTLIANSKTD